MSPDLIETTIRQAIEEYHQQGYSPQPNTWGIIFSKTSQKFVPTRSDYCCSPLAALIMTKDNDPEELAKLDNPESERQVAAHILETEEEFVDGFINGFDGFVKAIQSPKDATITITDMLYSHGWDLGYKLRTELLNKKD
jgi:hypothetical protein